jgi:formate--tetrahydrofolate ligase
MSTPDLAQLAADLGLDPGRLLPFGRGVAKVDIDALGARVPRGKLVLVSAMTPTSTGEGKTTTSIGLGDGLRRIGERVIVALRQPSLGPLFGAKGGATGGGKARVIPSDRIELNFTGDLHAVAAAHNLLAAMVDNHLHFAGTPAIDPRHVRWRRALDMNDRALRSVVVGLGGAGNGPARESGFDMTAASEVLAILGLAADREDLRARLSRMIVGLDREGNAVRAGDLGAVGSMMAILRDAFLPNFVMTAEGTPAFVHGGPFANIAHGCSTVVATKLGLSLADWVVTEAGFGFDLGGEKFFDIKCRAAGLEPSAVVIVVTGRSVAAHGGGDLGPGLENLAQHIASARQFGHDPIIAINERHDDPPETWARISALAAEHGVTAVRAHHFARGGEGAEELARAVVSAAAARGATKQALLYPTELPLQDKLRTIATRIYGASEVVFDATAQKQLAEAERLGGGQLPVCVAKTPLSLSDDPKRQGRPRDFKITFTGARLSAGAGFVVAMAGDIMLMPGLPKRPRALDIDLRDGEVVGLA